MGYLFLSVLGASAVAGANVYHGASFGVVVGSYVFTGLGLMLAALVIDLVSGD